MAYSFKNDKRLISDLSDHGFILEPLIASFTGASVISFVTFSFATGFNRFNFFKSMIVGLNLCPIGIKSSAAIKCYCYLILIGIAPTIGLGVPLLETITLSCEGIGI